MGNLLNTADSRPRPKRFRAREFEGRTPVSTRRARYNGKATQGSGPDCGAVAAQPSPVVARLPHRMTQCGRLRPLRFFNVDAIPGLRRMWVPEGAFCAVPPSQRSRRRHMTTATTTITSQTQPGMAANRPNTAEITPPKMPRKAPKATSTTNARSRATKQPLQDRRDSSMYLRWFARVPGWPGPHGPPDFNRRKPTAEPTYILTPNTRGRLRDASPGPWPAFAL